MRSGRIGSRGSAVAGALALAVPILPPPAAAAAQSGGDDGATAARTAWGDPDLQGLWTTATLTRRWSVRRTRRSGRC